MARLRIERIGPVRTVTLTRADKRNAMDSEMLAALLEFFTTAPEPTDRVVVVRAQGSVFCAGIDLKERLAKGTPVGESPVEAVFHAMEVHPLPLVAVVQGDAIAGGNELAMHCDFVVAAEQARFGMSLAQIGIAPTWFLTKRLLEVAGPVATREILLLGDPLPARRCAELGIIARAVPAASLDVEAARIIDRLAANAPLALRAIKATINREMAFRDGIYHADVDALVARARGSDDAREGVAARLEKRPPRFTGS